MTNSLHSFWAAPPPDRRGIHLPSEEWLTENVRDGWDVELPLGGAGQWTYSVSRIDVVSEGMRVVVREQFAGTVEEYAALTERRFPLRDFHDREAPPDELWRFGVEFADGTRISTVDFEWMLRSSHSGNPDVAISPLGWSSEHFSDCPHPYWFAPAPSGSRLTFGLEWPLIGLGFSAVSVDLAELESLPRTPVEWPPKLLRFRLDQRTRYLPE